MKQAIQQVPKYFINQECMLREGLAGRGVEGLEWRQGLDMQN